MVTLHGGQQCRKSTKRMFSSWRTKLHWSHPDNSNNMLTHWRRVTHICVDNLSISGSDNGQPSPGWRQAIIWTIAGILSIGPFGTNSSEIFIEIHTFSFKKMHLKMLSGKCRLFCLGLRVLTLFFLPCILVWNNIDYPLQIWLKLKSLQIVFVCNVIFSGQIILKFCEVCYLMLWYQYACHSIVLVQSGQS